MTFEEWWEEKALKMIELNYGAEEIAHDAWKAAQPKWTMCKDGMPTEKDGTVVFVKFGKNEQGRAMAYYAGQWIEPFSAQIIKDVIAWQPLPEASHE